MKKTLLACLALASTVGLISSPAHSQSSVQNTEITTTTAQPAPRVLDSYMKPVYSRTRQITDADGNTEKLEEPMILERHEKVEIPGAETHVTTVEQKQQSVQAVKTTTTLAPRKHVAYRRPRPRYISHRPRHNYIAMKSHAESQQRKVSTTTVVKDEHIQGESKVLERRDPALDLY